MKLLNPQLPDSIRTTGIIALLCLFTISNAQTIKPQPDSVMQWYHDAKFGMFIHWGLYSGPAQGEWYMQKSAIPIDTYRKYAFPPTYQREPGDTAYFQADAFLNPTDMRSDWIKFAKAAGMRYMVITSKHHDGYSLTDSCHPNSFCAGQTLGKDLIGIYHQRCVDAGLRFGVYISVMDWRYPGYFDVNGNNCVSDRSLNSWGYTTDPAHKENARQMKEMFYAHVTHIMKKYSPVDYVFWDGGYLGMQGQDADANFFWEPDKYRSPTNQWQIDEKYAEYDSTVNPPKPLGVMGILRKYSPKVITNPRLGWVGDVESKEGNFDDAGNIDKSRPWERACNYNVQGGGYSAKWGYIDNDWRPMGYNGLVKALTNAIVRDGNLLLNFGPDRHGNIPKAAVDTVLRMGTWLNKVGDAVYGTRGGPWQPSDTSGRQYGFTSKKDKIFIHIQQNYSGTSFTTPAIPGGNSQVNKCYDLNTRLLLSFTKNGNGGITINGINRTVHPANSLVGIYMGSADIDTGDQIVPVKQQRTLPLTQQFSINHSNRNVMVHFTSADTKNSSVISLYTMQGRLVRCPMMTSATDISFNTSMIQAGIYYLKIKGKNGSTSISTMINKN